MRSTKGISSILDIQRCSKGSTDTNSQTNRLLQNEVSLLQQPLKNVVNPASSLKQLHTSLSYHARVFNTGHNAINFNCKMCHWVITDKEVCISEVSLAALRRLCRLNISQCRFCMMSTFYCLCAQRLSRVMSCSSILLSALS